ncbi:MAG TPA: hypothetical protein PKB11_00665 [Desulfovibrio sp.]|uniref:hypothetical protein n=1 Tax=Desulfovibrio TaxID=872 RepID=UPI000418BA76|nr:MULTISPECIES: hypothetical protein [Desulfovibrio]MDY0306901.1 hypothetical protein [Desulfovibrionaceae bacterium]HMM37246.1 hypothetical protein [Desulfovibrio sp.]
MDRRVIERLKEAFALDLYETVRAARQVRGEKVFRHTLYEDGQAVFCGFYPKAELLEFPGVDEEFISRLSTFNLLGVITDGVTRLDLFLLAGRNKPFTAAESHKDIAKLLREPELARFLDAYFKLRDVCLDIYTMTLEQFMDAVSDEVARNTPIAELQRVDMLMGEKGE